VADLFEPAKATALEKLGEGQHAPRIANVWVWTKQESGTVAEADYISGSTASARVFSASSKLATPMTATRRYSSPFRTLTDAEPS
jgi:hypothetical protein